MIKEPRRAGGRSAPHVPSRMKAISPSTTALQQAEANAGITCCWPAAAAAGRACMLGCTAATPGARLKQGHLPVLPYHKVGICKAHVRHHY